MSTYFITGGLGFLGQYIVKAIYDLDPEGELRVLVRTRRETFLGVEALQRVRWVTGHRDHRYLTITVDDDGPGIPVAQREDVFKPFLRLDDARNQDEGGTGLGLAIARDIARSHGGDIALGDSPLGGLRATVRVPV